MKAKSMSSHGGLVADCAAHARALMDNFRLQRDKKKCLKGRKTLCGCWL